MEFLDLNDDIVADDWLIPKREISNKRLLKRTSRHNIYKADWFGDVLVYEPIVTTKAVKTVIDSEEKRSATEELPKMKLEELESRLGTLNLHLSLSDLSQASHYHSPTTASSVSSDCDSAYSSISSTPQYHTKSQIQTEFQFPSSTNFPSSSSSSPLASWASSFTFESMQSATNTLDTELNEKERNFAHLECSPAPVILNRDSYKWCRQEESSSGAKITTKATGEQRLQQQHQEASCCWFELNELRLIAHESFMLFMGAVLEEQSSWSSCGSSSDDELSTSLVMQMNHPKAVPLHNLLHATKFSSTTGNASTPLDRFFSSLHHNNHHRQPLSLKAKLSVCQQVTNAMTYLHDKNIVHGKLTSVNIYLEFNQRVKISLIDNDETAIANINTRTGSPEFNLSSLTYLSPELIRTISVVDKSSTSSDHVPLVKIDTNQLTKKSDVFSFGTFLYELFHEKFPFSETQSASEIIYQIGSNQIESKNLYRDTNNNNSCPSLIMQTISACWRSEPNLRPHFKQLAIAQ